MKPKGGKKKTMSEAMGLFDHSSQPNGDLLSALEEMMGEAQRLGGEASAAPKTHAWPSGVSLGGGVDPAWGGLKPDASVGFSSVAPSATKPKGGMRMGLGGAVAGGLGALGTVAMLAQMFGGGEEYQAPQPTMGVGGGEEEMALRRMEMLMKANNPAQMQAGELGGLVDGYERQIAMASIPAPQRGARQVYAEMGLL